MLVFITKITEVVSKAGVKWLILKGIDETGDTFETLLSEKQINEFALNVAELKVYDVKELFIDNAERYATVIQYDKRGRLAKIDTSMNIA